MTEQEKTAIEEMKVYFIKLQQRFFSLATMIDRANNEQMKTYGYGQMTKDAAIAQIFRNTQKEIAAFEEKHFKKYPD